MAGKRGKTSRKRWTGAEIGFLRKKFPTMNTAYIAKEMGRTVAGIRAAAFALGLKKNTEISEVYHIG